MNRRTPSERASIRSGMWRLRLAKGVYRFGSDAKKLPGRLRVR